MRAGRLPYILMSVCLFAMLTACGALPFGSTTSAKCLLPHYPPQSPVTAAIDPVPIDVPGSGLDSDYLLQVPKAAEFLVVRADSIGTQRNTFVPIFTAPGGQSVTREQFFGDLIVGGNPGDLGMSEVMNVQSPPAGAWHLRFHNTTRASVTVKLRATATFHVHASPIVAATASPGSGPAPLTVQFDASGTKFEGANASYCWDFRDGPVVMGEKVSHTFRARGTYEVTLTAYDDKGSAGFGYTVVTVSS